MNFHEAEMKQNQRTPRTLKEAGHIEPSNCKRSNALATLPTSLKVIIILFIAFAVVIYND